jgi:hypothetical protein
LLSDIFTTQGEIMGILVGHKALGFTAPPVWPMEEIKDTPTNNNGVVKVVGCGLPHHQRWESVSSCLPICR